ncbi:MAG: hypothetical protein CVU16_03280 [Betaproteobacteria bacterium HGW-Betaproteobacteria-10]|nr:MAG: hypothetical protein CVU16_03280 [Betaproteobacteria bacterium HGW-Betaproteobacteria-10]
MTKYRKNVFTGLLASALLFGLAACQPEGPAEKAGKEIDQRIEKAGQQIEKAGEKIQDMANEAKK